MIENIFNKFYHEIQVWPNSCQNPQKIKANADQNCYESITDFGMNV